MENNLAIITSGGGLKCSFGAGVMLAFVRKFGIQEPRILLSCSGSSGTGAYYISKQYKSILNIWGNLLSTKNFVSPSRIWRIMDIDYLIDEVFKKQDPLNTKAVYSSQTHYLIPALNRQTGKVDYFSNKESVDIFEVMRATKALPLAFKLNPNISLRENTYCDSPLSSSPRTHLEKIVEMGSRKILIVDTSTQSSQINFEYAMFNLWASTQNTNFKRGYTESKRRLEKYSLPRDVKVFSISPRAHLPVKTFGNEKNSLRQAIKQGYDETISNIELAEFIGK